MRRPLGSRASLSEPAKAGSVASRSELPARMRYSRTICEIVLRLDSVILIIAPSGDIEHSFYILYRTGLFSSGCPACQGLRQCTCQGLACRTAIIPDPWYEDKRTKLVEPQAKLAAPLRPVGPLPCPAPTRAGSLRHDRRGLLDKTIRHLPPGCAGRRLGQHSQPASRGYHHVGRRAGHPDALPATGQHPATRDH